MPRQFLTSSGPIKVIRLQLNSTGFMRPRTLLWILFWFRFRRFRCRGRNGDPTRLHLVGFAARSYRVDARLSQARRHRSGRRLHAKPSSDRVGCRADIQFEAGRGAGKRTSFGSDNWTSQVFRGERLADFDGRQVLPYRGDRASTVQRHAKDRRGPASDLIPALTSFSPVAVNYAILPHV